MKVEPEQSRSPAPLLCTKLLVPRIRSRLVERGRLASTLDGGLAAGVVMLMPR